MGFGEFLIESIQRLGFIVIGFFLVMFGGGVGFTHQFTGVIIIIFGFIMIAYGVKNRDR
nr:hypothetical protein [Methanosarcina mazei]